MLEQKEWCSDRWNILDAMYAGAELMASEFIN
jgi:hypothetical protein